MKVSNEGASSSEMAVTPSTKRAPISKGGVKKTLVAMVILGAITTLIQPGTFANFTAETDNGATIQTGTLVLENKLGNPVVAATDCYSTNGLGQSNTVPTANTGACSAYFLPANGGTTTGGGSTVTGVQLLTLKDIGTLNAATGNLAITCTTSANLGAAPFSGSGDLCAGLKIIVAETLADFSTLKTPNTALVGACTGATVATCPLSGGFTGLASGGTTNANPGGFTAGTSRFFYISVGLAGTNDNALQGRSAAMSFKWLATE